MWAAPSTCKLFPLGQGAGGSPRIPNWECAQAGPPFRACLGEPSQSVQWFSRHSCDPPASEGLWAGRTRVTSGPRAGGQVPSRSPVSDYGSEFLGGTQRPGAGASSLWVRRDWGCRNGVSGVGPHEPSRSQTARKAPSPTAFSASLCPGPRCPCTGGGGDLSVLCVPPLPSVTL